MTKLQKENYISFLNNALMSDENKNELIYGKGVKQEQRFFWLHTFIQALEHNAHCMYLDEDFKQAELKRNKEIIEGLLKIVMGFLLWYYKSIPVVIGYTIDKSIIAIDKHPQFDDGYSNSRSNAFEVVMAEKIEWLYALKSEKMNRQIAEAFDVAVTCCRYLNREYEENE